MIMVISRNKKVHDKLQIKIKIEQNRQDSRQRTTINGKQKWGRLFPNTSYAARPAILVFCC